MLYHPHGITHLLYHPHGTTHFFEFAIFRRPLRGPNKNRNKGSDVATQDPLNFLGVVVVPCNAELLFVFAIFRRPLRGPNTNTDKGSDATTP